MAEYFSTNLKHLREKRGLSQNKLAKMVGVNQTTIARWEDDNRVPTIDNAVDVANVLNISLPDLIGKDLRFDNATYMKPIIDDDNMIQIPVLGTIKAGIPIEAQENIIEYIDIPKDWTKGGKTYYGLQISGDSMFPKYQEKDIVIFEKSEDFIVANGKDCAVMVNGYDATFKKVLLSNEGITLVPYNTGAYDLQMYSNKDIEEKPIRIIGIAKEIRTRL